MTTNTKRGSRSTRSATKRDTKKPGSLAKLKRSPVRERMRQVIEENRLTQEDWGADEFGYYVSPAEKDFGLQKANLHEIPAAAWDALLDDIRETGNIAYSCRRVGIKRVTVYKRVERDEDFKKDLAAAHQTGLAHLEDVAVHRATQGVKKPVFFQGEIVGFTQEYSDQLLSFLLQGNHPKYRRGGEQGDGAALGGGVLVVPAPLDGTDWESAAMEMQKKLRSEVRD